MPKPETRKKLETRNPKVNCGALSSSTFCNRHSGLGSGASNFLAGVAISVSLFSSHPRPLPWGRGKDDRQPRTVGGVAAGQRSFVGRIHLSSHSGAPADSRPGERCSLSPRERAGVRGNKPLKAPTPAFPRRLLQLMHTENRDAPRGLSRRTPALPVLRPAATVTPAF